MSDVANQYGFVPERRTDPTSRTPPTPPGPGGEAALHKTMIRVLKAAILAAGNGQPYPVLCTCERCQTPRTADLGRSPVTVDQVLHDGIGPDLLVCAASGYRCSGVVSA